MNALLLDCERKCAGVARISIPTPASNELLIHVHAVALNPVDALYVYNPLGATGRVIGSDFAGVVKACGGLVPVSSMKVGDRVAGFLQGACSVNERPGAFAEWLVCPWDLVWKIAEDKAIRDAATVSLCALTAAQALYFRMGLPPPFHWVEDAAQPQRAATVDPGTLKFLIYGAATSVGMYAAQLVRASAAQTGQAITLLGTASPKHFRMLSATPYSYNHLIDYHRVDWPAKILELTHGAGLDYAFDCISEGTTVSNIAGILNSSSSSSKMAVVRSREGGAWTSPAVLPIEPSYGAVWEGLGEEVQYQGMNLLASREARTFAVTFYQWLSQKGQLEPNPVRIMPNGLKGIAEDGLPLLGSGTMEDRNTIQKSGKEWMGPLSGEKMVYDIANE